MGSEIASLLFYGLAFFTLTFLLTYHANDPSFFSNISGYAKNACGWVGSYTAAFLLQALGMGAFLLPVAFFFMGITLFQREGLVKAIATLGGMVISVSALSVYVTLQWEHWEYAGNLLLIGG